MVGNGAAIYWVQSSNIALILDHQCSSNWLTLSTHKGSQHNFYIIIFRLNDPLPEPIADSDWFQLKLVSQFSVWEPVNSCCNFTPQIFWNGVSSFQLRMGKQKNCKYYAVGLLKHKSPALKVFLGISKAQCCNIDNF